jgi:hypothetical protein
MQLLKKDYLFGVLSALCFQDQHYNHWKLNTVEDAAFLLAKSLVTKPATKMCH